MMVACLLVLGFVEPLGHIEESKSPNASATVASMQAGYQVQTSGGGDLKLVNSSGQSETMTDIVADANGNVSSFRVGLVTYKWSPREGVYNPTTYEMNFYRFKRLSPGRYSWEKCNANGNVMDSGSLDT